MLIPTTYFARIIFPERKMYDFRVINFEEILFQIMTLENFEETKQAFKEFSQLDQEGSLYPTVLRVARVDSTNMLVERQIVNPKALWEMNINNYFYRMVNKESTTLINYSMHHMHQFRYEEYLDNGVFYEIPSDMDKICKYKGICNKNECRECGFSYKNFRE